jgi:hypothetical protein
MDVVAEHSSLVSTSSANYLRIPRCGYQDSGVRPVLFPLLPAPNELRDDEAAAEKQDGAVKKHFEALRIAEMETRQRNIPAERQHGTRE